LARAEAAFEALFDRMDFAFSRVPADHYLHGVYRRIESDYYAQATLTFKKRRDAFIKLAARFRSLCTDLVEWDKRRADPPLPRDGRLDAMLDEIVWGKRPAPAALEEEFDDE